VIEVDRLTFRYPGASSDALRELSLRVRTGALFGLLGPNGSGKTTLVSLIAGVLPAPRGALALAGQDPATAVRALDGALSLVPQEYAFYPRLTVQENLRFFAGVQALPRALVRERIDEVLGIGGLTDARRRRAEELSGGMKRRLNFAIGLLNRPRLLLLDEPTVGIDPQSRAFILESVRRVNAQGTTVIYTSHYMEEVQALCDEIAVIDRGRLLVQGSLAQLLRAERGHHNLEQLFLHLTQRSLRDD
jgi:ABC-2 type transport system ATP-binding protein